MTEKNHTKNENKTGLHGHVGVQGGTNLDTARDMAKEYQPNSVYTDPSKQAKADAGLEATFKAGNGTVSIGADGSALRKDSLGENAPQVAGGSAHVQLNNIVPGMEHLRASGFVENSSSIDKKITDRDAAGGALEIETKKSELGGDWKLHGRFGGRVEASDTSTVADNASLVKDDMKLNTLAHAEAVVGTKKLEISAGGVAGTTSWDNTSINTEKKNGPEVVEDSGTKVAGAQATLGLGANLGDSTRLNTKFFLSPMELMGKNAPADAGANLDSRVNVDVTHQISDKVSATLAGSASQHLQQGTVGIQYGAPASKDFGFFFSGEAGVAHYNSPESGNSTVKPLVQVKTGLSF